MLCNQILDLIVLPVNEISLSTLAAKLGVSASDVSIKVVIEPATDTNGSIKSSGLTAVSPVIEFHVSAVGKDGKEIPVVEKKFSDYVDRDITGVASFDATHSTGVTLKADGTVMPLPTFFSWSRCKS